jgi:hypothetical protein
METAPMRKTAVVVSLGLALLLAGCPKLERDAYTVAVGAKAFIETVENAHPECETQHTQFCDKLAVAAHAQRLLVEAGKVYCGSQDFLNGGPCHPPDKKTPAYQMAADKLSAAISAYKNAETDLSVWLRH